MSVFFYKETNIAYIDFDQPDSKVNVLTGEALRKLDTILDELKNHPALTAVVIRSLKKDIFIAGADIKEIEGIRQAKDGEAKSKAGQRIFDKLEDLKIPAIAVIDGVALGGGCELALSCHYRIATFNDKVRIGCPEVNLGFVPGFGGTYRFPKVVGLTQGIKMVAGGQAISGKDAFKIGLVDRLYPQPGLDQSILKFVGEVTGDKKFLRKKSGKKGVQFFLEETALGRTVLFDQARKNTLKLTKGFYPAPIKAIEVIQNTFGKDRPTALDIEAKAFSELAITPVSKNLVKVFYVTEKYKKLMPPGSEKIVPKTVEKCGVIGAGVMGGGIAQLLSHNGIKARLKDINYDAIAKGYKAAYKIYEQAVKRRKILPAQAQSRMALITGTLDYSGFKNADIVIEAVVEKMEVKKKVFKELGEQTGSQTILCTNTSALPVTEMAKEVSDPSRVIGMHFFNPVHRMPLIEIIKTSYTSPSTLVTTLQLARRLGKTPIVVKDSCGFLVNRILLGYINEAGRILEETGDMESIDKIVTRFGMPMGPFALCDEVGLDVGIKVLHILEDAFGDRFKPAGIFEEIFSLGLLGKKSGKGFYLHQKKVIPNPQVTHLVENILNKKTLSEEEIMNRMLYIMINEAAMCLEDGIVDEADAVDVGMIMGTGFPPFRGGLLRYADSLGIENIITGMKSLESKMRASRFSPCNYILNLKAKESKFFD